MIEGAARRTRIQAEVIEHFLKTLLAAIHPSAAQLEEAAGDEDDEEIDEAAWEQKLVKLREVSMKAERVTTTTPNAACAIGDEHTRKTFKGFHMVIADLVETSSFAEADLRRNVVYSG